MLILTMGQWPCCCQFCLWNLPIHQFFLIATVSLFNYHTYRTQNCWRSIDTHSQNWAVMVLLSLLPMKASNTLVMPISNQITIHLPYLQDQKLLMLQWRAFYSTVHSTSAAIDNCFHIDFNSLTVFLPDWDSRSWQCRAQEYCCTVHSHTININISC